MSIRTRSTRSNSGLTAERTLDFLKRGWRIVEVIPKDSRYCVGFRLVLPDNPDAPILLVHNVAAGMLLTEYTGKGITSLPRREDDPPYYIRYHVWTG